MRPFRNFQKVDHLNHVVSKNGIFGTSLDFRYLKLEEDFDLYKNSLKNDFSTLSRESLTQNFITSFYRSIIQVQPICVTTINRIKRITLWNKSTKNLTGRPEVLTSSSNKILPEREMYSLAHGALGI